MQSDGDLELFMPDTSVDQGRIEEAVRYLQQLLVSKRERCAILPPALLFPR